MRLLAAAHRRNLSQATAATVAVDLATAYQTLDGFGATGRPLIYAQGGGGSLDYLTAPQRTALLDYVFGDCKINLPYCDDGAMEANANDDSDANTAGTFDFRGVDNYVSGIASGAASRGVTMRVGGVRLWTKGTVMAWLRTIRASNYNTYLSECAEFAFVGFQRWVNQMGYEPDYYHLYNEPLSGGQEIEGGITQDLVDIVKAVGARFRAGGYNNVMLVVPSEETMDKSIESATAILADATARQYVGAISYHPYPYGSAYASVVNILAQSGAGTPNATANASRANLLSLANTYGKKLWMTEVSEGPGNSSYPDPEDIRYLRARAIHIHDEMRYARASAFFGMLLIWDRNSHIDHFGNTNYFDEQSTIALLHNDTSVLTKTGMSRAIGHYSRVAPVGSQVVSSSSNDSLVQVTAFKSTNKFSVVLINNASTARAITINLTGGTLVGTYSGEHSEGAATRWGTPPTPSIGSTSITVALPAECVTSYAFDLVPPAGTPDAPTLTAVTFVDDTPDAPVLTSVEFS
jgi:O-glycosyl hydrolase